MHLYIAIPLAALIIALNVLKFRSLIGWVLIWWVSVFVFLRFGFTAPLPASIIQEYMVILTLSLGVYVISSRERIEQVREPFLAFVTDPKHNRSLLATMIFLALLVAGKVYTDNTVKIQPPAFGRTVHPAPPTEITFKGKKIDLIRGENPFRKLKGQEFDHHVQRGKVIYYQNCHFCHGDSLEGNGHYAEALDPIPTNFADPATIAMLQENFLFWRIAKGGIGLPDEAGPWASAMPAWEDFLSEDDIWNVILFLYEYTGQKPRAMEHHE